MKETWKTGLGRGLFKIFFLGPLAILWALPFFVAGAALGTYIVFSRDLPEIPGLASYQPRTVSTFFSDDGTVIGIFYKQKRFVVDLGQMPHHVVDAFLAAEDARFYEHNGVDWTGIARAMFRNVRAGRIVQGGSTITMQVTRSFLLTRERSFSRKIKEIILAQRLEKVWGKEKVLYVYLNEIYLGEGNYGVEAAARGYFDKPVEHLTLAEGALIAGLVASPARFNPFKSEELARQKQLTVLGRMFRGGFITENQYNQAKDQELVIRREPPRPFDLVPDFAEAVRRYVIRNYGEEKLYNEGLKVFTTCRIDYQKKAQDALEKGLAEIRARQKHLAILRTVPPAEIPDLLERRSTPNLTQERIYQGVVVKVVPRKHKETELYVALSKKMKGLVRLRDSSASVYKVGQVLALRFENFVDETPLFTLDDNPQLQGALVCIENRTGYVRSLVGGVSGDNFKFNRALQAKRQPGSAFKPVIYSVALEEKSYSPATIIVDEPIIVDLERADEEWEPKNAGGNFLGPLSFRRALELSRNICTIKILIDVGLDPVIKMAGSMGISTPLGRNLSLSLGTSEMSLFELTAAYTVFPNSGLYVEPVLVKRIEDRHGNVLEDNSEIPMLEASEIPHPRPREEYSEQLSQTSGRGRGSDDEEEPSIQELKDTVAQKERMRQADSTGNDRSGIPTTSPPSRVRAAMSPQTAYIMTSLLQGGVREGTGSRMSQYLKRRDLAGKTGTTNNSEDTWFIGFNPDFTAGVWVGFDEKRPVGRREEGGRAALPIWGFFMKGILDNRPQRDFPVPPDITFKDMLTFTGNLADGFVPKVAREPIYTPFSGLTLVLNPQDTPETLASYRGVNFPDAYFPHNTQVYSQPGPYSSQIRPGFLPTEPPGTTVPLNPMDGRNLFPTEPRPDQGVSTPPLPSQPSSTWGRPPVAAVRQPHGPVVGPEGTEPRGVIPNPGAARVDSEASGNAVEPPVVPKFPYAPNPHYAPYPDQ
ncbi:MAG: PBP1A family penicillin-binding protein [Desulfomonile sp.]